MLAEDAAAGPGAAPSGGRTTDRSWFCFADDLPPETAAAELEKIARRSGVADITIAAAYHSARDVFPHRDRGRVRFLEPGVVYFQPERHRYGRIAPTVASHLGTGDDLARLCQVAHERGARVSAWVVVLHNDRLGFADPDLAVQNAFGDPIMTDLCPSHPDVRRYVTALIGDVARYPVSAIRAESMHFPSLSHGYHHERFLEPLDQATMFLLGMCFCEHCRSAAQARDVDAEAVRAAVRGWLDERLRSGGTAPADVTPAGLSSAVHPDLARYGVAQAERVTSLVHSAQEEAAGVRVHFVDVTGAGAAFLTGAGSGPSAASAAWRYGIDLAGVTRTGARLEVTAYGRDPVRLGEEMTAYRAALDDSGSVGAIIRPGPPDCRSAGELRAGIESVQAAGAESLHFYHYGLYRERSLDWVGEALAGN